MKISLLLLIAYLLGSVPTGLWIGQVFYKKNLREHGSGNTGTTNTFRILGAKAGIATFIIDALKGTIATCLPALFGVGINPFLFGFFAIIGHTFPVFAKFKGGKAVATSAGVLLGYSPLFLLFLIAIFGIVLYLYSMISLASVVAASVAIINVVVFPAYHFILTIYDPLFMLITFAIATLIIIRHRENLKRIRQKKENIVPFGWNLSHQSPTR
ncbi:glycerol-3-phosphate 1-O-acyltransferase PlsY [Streptococcus sciuri]|uniref:Glycerol-3-phosphate acyltransferase n=1 Tax=Streptococcus sciuri TaxID=2973939 RepID=A0ABT2F6D5_9STRE|nr:glycerol-3-phosphate 1-O-acyltransferase PlsY [Streptococcus sciuri]MCS4487753.1 glycerol-3-phosphate 1-O-acyltransferase PlsY [Streptococcus sciuri]